jgi:hypothetical protein
MGPPDVPWVKNDGRMPSIAAGKRVRVRLRNGMCPPESWAADGKLGCRWSLTGHPFDILEFEVL